MKIGLVSLGCSKNRVDSENILGWFSANEHTIVSDLSKAEAIIVNTCGFIEPAKKESIDTILEMAQYKNKNCKHLIVSGCLVQRYKDDLVSALPEVDAWVRIQDYPKMDEVLGHLLDKPSKVVYGKQERLQTTAPHTAYLKIAEGCSNRCSYCAIPLIRGNMDSYPLEKLVEEAQRLALKGVKELVLIAQDTSRYGEDKGSNQLVELCTKLNQIEGLVWIRLLYLYPNAVSDSFLEGIKPLTKVLPYFDIPTQHADDTVLKRMHRKGTQRDNQKVIEHIRAQFPHAVLRSTLIVGFPGETEEQFQTLLRFVESTKFDRLGAFIYSPEEDTAAFTMVDDIPYDIKEERLHRLMRVQEIISQEKMEQHVGEVMEVMVEKRDSKQLSYHGRSFHMAPDDVDGEVIFSSDRLIPNGSLVQVKIDAVSAFDMMGHEV